MTVNELVKLLGHEGAWLESPFHRIWADQVTNNFAAEVLLGL